MENTHDEMFEDDSDDELSTLSTSSSDKSWQTEELSSSQEEPDTDSDFEMAYDFNSPMVEEPYNPPSLSHIAKFNIAELIYDVCVDIERRYGSYEMKKCAEKVDSLCRYLVSEIGRLVLEVWEEIVIVAGRKRMMIHRIKDHNIIIKGLNLKLNLTVQEWHDLITGKSDIGLQ